ncbi:MAG: SURF1 family protein [Candidatus Methylopumilus sp.]|nr:SURF1 family protein [Candidatus Methylopumilus sp.]
MSPPLSNKRIVLALVLLAIVGGVCVLLGFWQLERAEQRQAIAADIQSGRQAAPVNLNASIAQKSPFKNWTPALAQGRWRGEFSVLLDNRNLAGRPGLWLATPLEMEDGRAVLVLRGWLARPIGDQRAPVVDTPRQLQNIQGELTLHVPRLFELWTSGSANPSTLSLSAQARSNGAPERVDTGQLLRLQNLPLEKLSEQTGLNLLPVVLLQTSASNDGLIRAWPEPSVDADKNVGYAMQWFGFATICFIALLVLIWRQRRNR